MAVNPLISLQTQSLDFGQAANQFAGAKQAVAEQEQQQEMIDLRKRGIELDEIRTAIEQEDAATQRRIKNTALTSMQLKNALESGGEDAALQFLQGARESNERLGFDSNETDDAIELLQKGETDKLNTMLDNNIMIGEATGVIERPTQQETFSPVLDDAGNIIGQRSSTSGKVVSDPRSGEDTGQFKTLSPEESQKAGFPEGSVIQRGPKGELVVKFEPGGRDSDRRDREIADMARDLEQNAGLSPERARTKATRFVDGRARVEVSEDGQSATFVDEVALASGEEDAVTQIQLREPEQPERVEIEPAESLYALADKATGPQATLRSLTARIPFTNVSEGEREAISSRRAFDLTVNELARGLVNNDRFPVKEREAVIDAVNISPSVFDNPEAMKVRLSAARDFLETRAAQAERDAKDETLPQETRDTQGSNASAMRNAIDRIGVPAEQTASTIQQIADLDTESARFVVDDMPQEHLREMIANASDEELERIPEIRTWMAERLRENQ